MQVPTLQTERLLLLPLSAECEAMYECFYTDESASKEYGGPLSSAAAWTRLASDVGNWQLSGFGVWAVKRRSESDHVGICGFWQGKGWPRELTWWLLPEVRGQGIAAEASRAVVAYAYSNFGWETVETYMNDANEAARALVNKLGGVKKGRQRFPDGLERDVFSIPRPDAAYPQ